MSRTATIATADSDLGFLASTQVTAVIVGDAAAINAPPSLDIDEDGGTMSFTATFSRAPEVSTSVFVDVTNGALLALASSTCGAHTEFV